MEKGEHMVEEHDGARTLENKANLTLERLEIYQNDPMFHQLSLRFDEPGYKGMMCAFLEKSENSRLMLFPDRTRPPGVQRGPMADSKLEEIDRQLEGLFARTQRKPLCPMLDKYRGYFTDQSIVFPGTKSAIPGERTLLEGRTPGSKFKPGLKTNDRVLEALDESFLETMELDTKSMIEELERVSVVVEEDAGPEHEALEGDYQVENYSEKRRLQEELMDNQMLSQNSGRSDLASVSQLVSNTSKGSVKGDFEHYFFSEDFQYWACVEPEKWKVKAKRIKTSKKRLKSKQKELNRREKELDDFELVFAETIESNLESAEVIQILKQRKKKPIDFEKMDFEDVDPVIPLNPNMDLYSIFSTRSLTFFANKLSRRNRQPEVNLLSQIMKNSENQMDIGVQSGGDFASEGEVEGEQQTFDETLNDSSGVAQPNGGPDLEGTPFPTRNSLDLIEIPNENTLDISRVRSLSNPSSTRT